MISIRDMNAPIDDLIRVKEPWASRVLADRWEELTSEHIRFLLGDPMGMWFVVNCVERHDLCAVINRVLEVSFASGVSASWGHPVNLLPVNAPLTDTMVRAMLQANHIFVWCRPHHFTDDQLVILTSTPLGSEWLETNVGLLGLLQ